jgi:hypothetical protein
MPLFKRCRIIYELEVGMDISIKVLPEEIERLPKEMKDISERVGGLVYFDNNLTRTITRKIMPHDIDKPFTDEEKKTILTYYWFMCSPYVIVFD